MKLSKVRARLDQVKLSLVRIGSERVKLSQVSRDESVRRGETDKTSESAKVMSVAARSTGVTSDESRTSVPTLAKQKTAKRR